MFGQMVNGKYVHKVRLSPEAEAEADALMRYDNRSLSNLTEKAIHDKFTKLPQKIREELMKANESNRNCEKR